MPDLQTTICLHKLETRSICAGFDGQDILENVSIYLDAGELVSILGVSGVGKSTLFNIISGLLKPQSGSVILNGEDITGKPGHIAYMLQKDLLLPYRTIEDNAALPLLIRGVSKKEARETVRSKLPEFGLEGTGKKWPSQLSGGMRQRAALLRTYLFSEDVALLDEPFSALDTLTKTAIHSWYLGVMEKINLSTFFITHDIDEALTLSDRVYIIKGRPGKIAGEMAIDIPRSERGEEFRLSQRFLDYKRSLTAMLE